MPRKVDLKQLQAMARGPKRRRRKRAPCGVELISVLTCLKGKNFDAVNCAAESRKLTECLAAAKTAKTAHKPTMNFHIRRIMKD